MELYEYTANELLGMLKTGKCSAKELTQSVNWRIAAAEPAAQAYLTLCTDSAEKAAEKADGDIAAGRAGALCGIPTGIKDNICTDGVRTTCGSRMLENFVPPYDATVVKKLAAAGAVTTGKLNMDEFAMGSSCETSYFKKTRNPHDTSRVPGGSSGGSAAAVAAGECVLALGSDTGGSIRQPASLCGVVGLKPTYGTVSRFGLVAFASSLDQIGPLARSVTDAALLYDVIKGYDPLEATSADKKYEPVAGSLDGDVTGLRIGIPKEYYGEGVSCEVREKVLAAAHALERSGAVLVDISLPSTDYALSAYYIIACAEASSNLARFDGVKYGYRAEGCRELTELYERSRSEGFGDEVKRRIMLGTFVLSSGYYDAYYKKAKLTQLRIASEFDAAFGKCDVILTPTSPVTAFKIGEKSGNPLEMYAADICTVPVNIAGLPAMSMPCGEAGGLPVGMQLIGRKFDERTVLNTGRAYELACGLEIRPVLKEAR
jgi:aspartyl-tRNA(Asn)/glutamyl-tRNA(Gln) amidotransferase subunit A